MMSMSADLGEDEDMRSHERWLHEGLQVLAEAGATALTIESLSARLGLSKGSFYHHFNGMPDYRRALLEYFEKRENREFIERAHAATAAPGEARLRRIVADVVSAEGGRPRLESAVRSWAADDPVAREYLGRIDRARVDFAQAEFEAMNLEEQAAADFAQIAHLMSIGAAATVPPQPPSEIARLWDRLLQAAARCAGSNDTGT